MDAAILDRPATKLCPDTVRGRFAFSCAPGLELHLCQAAGQRYRNREIEFTPRNGGKPCSFANSDLCMLASCLQQLPMNALDSQVSVYLMRRWAATRATALLRSRGRHGTTSPEPQFTSGPRRVRRKPACSSSLLMLRIVPQPCVFSSWEDSLAEDYGSSAGAASLTSAGLDSLYNQLW